MPHVRLKAGLQAKLKDLLKQYPDENEPSLLREAFRIAYPLMKAGKTIMPDLEDISDEAAARIEEESPEFVGFELVGEVAAGKPIDYEIDKESIPLPKEAYGKYADKGAKLVRVRGDSMQEAGINDGGLILFRPQKTAENGQIVIADIKGDGTVVKKLHHEKGTVVLLSMNPEYAPLIKKPGEVVIHGIYLSSVVF